VAGWACVPGVARVGLPAMGYVVVAIFFAVFAVLAVGALALQVIGLSGRVRMLEKGREVERRHREHPTLRVERTQDSMARLPPEPEDDQVGVVLKNLGPRSPQ
jgi:hypothetical protein